MMFRVNLGIGFDFFIIGFWYEYKSWKLDREGVDKKFAELMPRLNKFRRLTISEDWVGGSVPWIDEKS